MSDTILVHVPSVKHIYVFIHLQPMYFLRFAQTSMHICRAGKRTLMTNALVVSSLYLCLCGTGIVMIRPV